MGRAGCRGGDNEDARGDETRGRFVLIASDMIGAVSKRMVESNARVGVRGGRESAWVWRGNAGVGERRKVGKKRRSKRARPYKRMYASHRSLCSLCWGPRSGVLRLVGVLVR